MARVPKPTVRPISYQEALTLNIAAISVGYDLRPTITLLDKMGHYYVVVVNTVEEAFEKSRKLYKKTLNAS